MVKVAVCVCLSDKSCLALTLKGAAAAAANAYDGQLTLPCFLADNSSVCLPACLVLLLLSPILGTHFGSQ